MMSETDLIVALNDVLKTLPEAPTSPEICYTEVEGADIRAKRRLRCAVKIAIKRLGTV